MLGTNFKIHPPTHTPAPKALARVRGHLLQGYSRLFRAIQGYSAGCRGLRVPHGYQASSTAKLAPAEQPGTALGGLAVPRQLRHHARVAVREAMELERRRPRGAPPESDDEDGCGGLMGLATATPLLDEVDADAASWWWLALAGGGRWLRGVAGG